MRVVPVGRVHYNVHRLPSRRPTNHNDSAQHLRPLRLPRHVVRELRGELACFFGSRVRRLS